MQSIILAAGLGSRLGELTKECTKCMVKINGITLIERMLRQLDRYGMDRIIIVTGYKGDILKDYVQNLRINTPVVLWIILITGILIIYTHYGLQENSLRKWIHWFLSQI